MQNLTRGTRRWMIVSGVVGFTFFLTCNFYLKQVVEWRTLTALGQIGATVPVVMATITVIRVLIPLLP